MLIFTTLLIGMEDTKTPAQNSETGETPQARSGEEARRSPAESEVSEMEINSLV